MGFAAKYLSQSERESVARSLFQVTKVYGAKLNGLCPAHEEKSPSFFYNVESDSGACSGCGFKGDLVTIWCHRKGLDARSEGFKEFCREFGIKSEVRSQESGVGKRMPRPMRPEPKREVEGVWRRGK